MGRISRKLVDEFNQQISNEADDDEFEASLPEELFAGLEMPEDLVDEDLDPLYVHYVMAQHFASMFSEGIADLEEFEEFYDIAVESEEAYQVDENEGYPITGSFFWTWLLFDFSFGEDDESIATCLVYLLMSMGADESLLAALRSLAESHMGIYEHRGFEGDLIRLRELLTAQELLCHSVTEYTGKAGELWFVRLGAPLLDEQGYHVTLTTPYVLSGASSSDWTAYLNKSLLDAGVDKREALKNLMKHGKPNDRTFWHDFILRAFQVAAGDMIRLAGLPDVPSSLPNPEAGPLTAEQRYAETTLPVTLTLAQRRVVAELLPEIASAIDLRSKRRLPVDMTHSELAQAADVARERLATLKGAKRKPYQQLIDLRQQDQLQSSGDAIYRLLIVLCDVTPEIWRRIEVPDMTLDELHVCIQIAFGWENMHLYDFMFSGRRYGPRGSEASDTFGMLDEDEGDTGSTYLRDVVSLGASPCIGQYMYDFGDSWTHSIAVEAVEPARPKQKYPKCLEGERAGPPEDCGGSWSYQNLLETLQNPGSTAYEEMAEWLGGDFDPEAFNASLVTRLMRTALNAG